VREVCAATGLLGESIASIFPDYGFFVDFFTKYYTDLEPGSALVVEAEGKVVGYLLGCTDGKRHRRFQRGLLRRAAFHVIGNLCRGSYGPQARRFLWWLVWRGWREIPAAPAGAHFHFNILKRWRDAATTRLLVDVFLELLRREHPGVKLVWGQMETFGARRSRDLFRRLGWEFYDQVRLGKYRYLFGETPPPHLRKIASGEVYLTTIYRRL